LLVHASLFWRQYDVAVLQKPPMQPCEQHCEPDVQALPEARHCPPLSVTHVPVHLPLQHWLPLEQETPRFLHALARHCPSGPHTPEQHCEFEMHVVVEPFWMHGPLRLPHWFGPKMPHTSPVGQFGVLFRPHGYELPHPSGA
jgi:hypothetical protein